MLFPLAVGACIFMIMAQKDLGAVTVPVALYALVISIMLWRELARMGVKGISKKSAWIGSIGALLFVLSDSLLGINRFVEPFYTSRYSVIITY